MRAWAAMLVLAGCRFVEKEAKRDDPSVSIVRVFYGTDRKATGKQSTGNFFGSHRGELSYGVCEVSVPRDHRMGQTNIKWWHKERHERPESHVLLLTLVPKAGDAFFGELRAAAQGRPAFVFIHGYNVAFDDAVRRTAQMAQDMAFDGTPLTWSWPSKAELTGYGDDEEAVAKTVPNLRHFLEEVAARSGASALHVVAHSMGNRALLAALKEPGAARFGEVVSAAPDVDADEFRRVAPAVAARVARMTLYASSEDAALKASRLVHRTGRRAGDSGDEIVLVPKVDSIDVSAADSSLMGHSYYGETKSVLSDLALLLRERKPPSERPNLKAGSRNGIPYWTFR